ncbi:hypothetical protein GPL06_21425 [Bacteroides salyersiae]|nr:hypothetical protein [Bacteroides salyersiae]
MATVYSFRIRTEYRKSIHLLVNPSNRSLSPWYELSPDSGDKLYTTEWVFNKSDLKQFK